MQKAREDYQLRQHKLAQSSEPGLRKKAEGFKKAVDRWRDAGSPLRPQEEIDRIITLCRGGEGVPPCEYFSADNWRDRCLLCGCNVNKSPNGLMNKIAMATESCPAEKW